MQLTPKKVSRASQVMSNDGSTAGTRTVRGNGTGTSARPEWSRGKVRGAPKRRVRPATNRYEFASISRIRFIAFSLPYFDSRSTRFSSNGKCMASVDPLLRFLK